MQISCQDLQLQLPPHTQLLNHQVAGHPHSVLKHDEGYILKPILPNEPRGIREQWFYECIFNSADTSPTISPLKAFIPKYNGIWTTQVNSEEINYLMLEDVTGKFIIPCVMDVKIGAKTYDPMASFEKIQYEKNKYPEAEIIGFRIAGMKVFNESDDLYMTLGRNFGKKQTTDTLLDAFHLYLNKDTSFLASLILCGFIHRLSEIEEWFSTQRKFFFCSSSLLFVYEGKTSLWLRLISDIKNSVFPFEISTKCGNFSSDASTSSESSFCNGLPSYNESQNCALSNETTTCKLCNLTCDLCTKIQSESLVDVRMIDFAHVFEIDEEDINYLYGLRNLLHWFIELNKKINMHAQRFVY